MSKPQFRWNLNAFLPEAVAHQAEQAISVTAPDIERAALRGLREILLRDGLKGRHFKTVRVTITNVGPAPDKRGQWSLDAGGA